MYRHRSIKQCFLKWPPTTPLKKRGSLKFSSTSVKKNITFFCKSVWTEVSLWCTCCPDNSDPQSTYDIIWLQEKVPCSESKKMAELHASEHLASLLGNTVCLRKTCADSSTYTLTNREMLIHTETITMRQCGDFTKSLHKWTWSYMTTYQVSIYACLSLFTSAQMHTSSHRLKAAVNREPNYKIAPLPRKKVTSSTFSSPPKVQKQLLHA